MSVKVCVLAEWEMAAWEKEKQRPDCKNHRHVSKLEACEMAHHGEPRFSPYHQKIAEFVGPHHVRILSGFEWKCVEGSRLPRMVLLELGKRPPRSRLRDLRTRLAIVNESSGRDAFPGRAVIYDQSKKS